MSFAHHHRSHSRHTHPAGMYPVDDRKIDKSEKRGAGYRKIVKSDKRFHTRKSRYFFRDEMRKQLDGQESKT